MELYYYFTVRSIPAAALTAVVCCITAKVLDHAPFLVSGGCLVPQRPSTDITNAAHAPTRQNPLAWSTSAWCPGGRTWARPERVDLHVKRYIIRNNKEFA